MATSVDPIQTGLSHHQAGRFEQAEQVYRQILQANPRHAGAMHLLGLIALQVGRHPLAVEWISRAILVDGSQPAFHANLAEAFRGLGKLADAQACYEQVLRLQPEMPEVHNNLGTILQARGEASKAIACYQRAIALRPDYADAHNNLGTVYQDQGEWEPAMACYRQAVEAEPRYAKGYFNLGTALLAQDKPLEARAAFEKAVELDENYTMARLSLANLWQRDGDFARAEAEYRRALALQPAFIETLLGLGSLHQDQGNLEQAIECYQQALRIDANCAEAYYNWGTALKAQNRTADAIPKYQQAIACKPTLVDAHYNLGTVLHELGHLDEAVTAYVEAARLKPDFAMAHNNLGNVYKLQGKIDEAVGAYERALAAKTSNAEAFSNLGTLLQGQGKVAETIECYRQAIRSNPGCAEAYNNLGNALQDQGQFTKALVCYEKSLRLEPDSPEAHYNLGLLYLSEGRFAQAWPEFDWRLKCKNYPVRLFREPLWDGSPLEGKTVLVQAEQGFGDTLHFVRYLEKVRERGGKVLFEVQPALLPLLQSSGIEGVVASGSPYPPFDLHVPILNLPSLFRTDLTNLPARIPYLAADPRLVENWRKELAGFKGFKIGINWQGNSAYASDRKRSIALRHFAPLASAGGVQFFSLQKKAGAEQLAEVAKTWPIHDWGPRLDENSGAFMDTAALMKSLDLVITSDTAIAHLAGALGVKVWVALTLVPEWRWLLEREDSPWYPTMRLFRQTTLGDWQPVFERMATELRTLVGSQ